jgi:cell wall-associated NlpC family hydrolase
VTDRRLTPANGRAAHLSLRGRVAADAYVAGDWARVTAPLTDLRVAPEGRRDRQVIHGDRLLVLERREGWAFAQAEKDGYCGYVSLAALGADWTATHLIGVAGSHLYSRPDLKQPEAGCLTFGSSIAVTARHERFAETATGHFVPEQHIRPLADLFTDPVEVALLFLGTPYLWGGNSRAGIDCSGLVQASLLACGIPCPGDSDLQWAALGARIPDSAARQRGDLLFWPGHAAIALDGQTMIHANGNQMAVTLERIDDAIARIDAAGEGPLLGIRRL